MQLAITAEAPLKEHVYVTAMQVPLQHVQLFVELNV